MTSVTEFRRHLMESSTLFEVHGGDVIQASAEAHSVWRRIDVGWHSKDNDIILCAEISHFMADKFSSNVCLMMAELVFRAPRFDSIPDAARSYLIWPSSRVRWMAKDNWYTIFVDDISESPPPIPIPSTEIFIFTYLYAGLFRSPRQIYLRFYRMSTLPPTR